MITDDDIRELTDLLVETANTTDAIKEVAKQYQDRSLAIKIYDSAFNTGILLADGEIHRLNTLTQPTVTVNIDKNTYWKVINAENPDVQRIMMYRAFYTDQTITANSDGTDLLIHIENILKLFYEISKAVMG